MLYYDLVMGVLLGSEYWPDDEEYNNVWGGSNRIVRWTGHYIHCFVAENYVSKYPKAIIVKWDSKGV